MSNFNDSIAIVNDKLKYYDISLSQKATNEIGEVVEGEAPVGYAVINTMTGITELTSTLLPQAIYQAQHFDQTLEAVFTPEAKAPVLEMMNTEDVVPS